jgi:hypothetical protein
MVLGCTDTLSTHSSRDNKEISGPLKHALSDTFCKVFVFGDPPLESEVAVFLVVFRHYLKF